MIYDCFLFFNEIDVLQIRIEELKDVVDKFVLVEATKTHSGQKKPLYFQEYKHEFRKYLKRIVYYVVYDLPKVENDNRSPLERTNRNYIAKALAPCNCKDEDIILNSDVDEIPKADKIGEAIQLLEKNELVVFMHKEYLCYLNCILNQKWRRVKGSTVACKYHTFKNLTPHIIRYRHEAHDTYWWSKREIREGKEMLEKNMSVPKPIALLNDAGWHFRWLGGLDAMLYKQQSYMWGDEDKTAEKCADYIKHNVCRTNLHNKKNLLSYKLPLMQLYTGDSEAIECTKIYHDKDFEVNPDLPEYLKSNKEKYKHFFKFAIPYDEEKVVIPTFGKLYSIRKHIGFLVKKKIEEIKYVLEIILKEILKARRSQ